MTHQLDYIIQQLYRLTGLPDREQNVIAAKMQIILDTVVKGSKQRDATERTPGLGKGDIVIAKDFEASLPDSFWLGKE